eukprot:CAMPEP_0183733578 /NCGR_PEP_ID=MMETSP0737-20130205/41582_1 /TAXON_ID=385413 /ORGANISM="Thalassiosira miniscula, Strain CCMP1093" /LENGTH=58 /DNA_ID=CAMNT_0025966863 /DNA_START=1 /DNA_END=174 /DNA_ORIENTATION=-
MAERDVEQALRELQRRFSSPSSPTAAVLSDAANAKNKKSKSKLAFHIDEDDIRTVMGY